VQHQITILEGQLPKMLNSLPLARRATCATLKNIPRQVARSRPASTAANQNSTLEKDDTNV
jgi:hypothetical protein